MNPFLFLSQVKKEMGMVSWPSKQETFQTTLLVIVMALLFVCYFLISDYICYNFVQLTLM